MIAGILAGIVLSTCTVFADSISKTAEIFYNNIKIYIDGAEIVPKDATGKVVDPFIMNGTTYLPVRAVAEAFGKDVEWDGKTQSVYIGKKDENMPDNYLDKIQYNDYQEADGNSNFTIINGTVTDINGKLYTNGLLFYNGWNSSLSQDDDHPNIKISYPLNSQYSILKGKIVPIDKYNISGWGSKDIDNSPVDIWFYGDDTLLYKATAVNPAMPFSFELDVEGVNQLVIKVKTESRYSHVALTDLALYK